MVKVNFGVIGVKGIGKNHIESIKRIKEADLIALADIDETAGKAVAEQHHAKWYADYTKMLEQSDLDAVCICVPHFLHTPTALLAIDCGKHVLVEKPMAMTVGEADKMVLEAEKKGVKLGVMYQYRVEPAYSEMKAILDRGDLGAIYRFVMESCDLRTQAYYDYAPWRGSWRSSGGGVIINQSIHHLDLLQWFLGKPVRLHGWITTKIHRAEVEDLASALISFEGGAQGVIQASLIDALSITRFEICGDKAKLLSENGDVKLGVLETPIKEYIEKSKEVWDHPKCNWIKVTPKAREAGHIAILRDFTQALLEDREPLIPGREGLVSLEIANAIILSHFKGKTVTFPVDRNEYTKLMQKLQAGHLSQFAS
jgi:predicted dehydrogenase